MSRKPLRPLCPLAITLLFQTILLVIHSFIIQKSSPECLTEAFWVHDFVCNSKKRACIKNTKLSMRGKLRNQNALRMWKAWHNCLLNFSRLWPPSRTLRSIAFHTNWNYVRASVTITINCNVLDANQIVIQLYTIKVTFQVLFHSFHLLRKENKSMHLLQNQKQLWQLSFSASREKKFKWPHLKLWKRLDQSVLVLIVGHSIYIS